MAWGKKKDITRKVDKAGAGSPGSKHPTITHTSLHERMELVKICEGIGALAIGGRVDKVSLAVETLQKQSRTLLLQQHLDVWLPKFQEHFQKMESVIGPGLKLTPDNAVNELRQKVTKAGFPNVREFLIKVVLPVISYHGLFLFLNNQAGVRLPENARLQVVEQMNAINRVLGSACAGMVLQETMGL